MWRISILCVLLLSSFEGMAQGLPGYVVTLGGDTLKGAVMEERQRIFLYQPGSERKPFSPAQVQGYGLSGKAAIRSQVVHLASGAYIEAFVLPLQVGSASLYSYCDENGLLLQPPATDTLQELTDINWHVVLNRHLYGCATLDLTEPRFLNQSFTESHVQRILATYNKCLNPAWQNTATERLAWLHGVGIFLMPLHAYENPERYEKSRGSGLQGGLEWTAVRASGLQVSIAGTYTNEHRQTRPYTDSYYTGQEAQVLVREQLLGTTISAGQRWGRPFRPNVFAGAGVGLDYMLHGETVYKQRPVASSDPFKTFSTSQARGELIPHAEITTGLFLTMKSRKEIRLLAVYRHYLRSSFNHVGLQMHYILYRK